MKQIAYLFFGLALFCTACNEDNTTEVALRYDGSNANAPLLAADVYEAAARFPATITRDFVGNQLTEVDFFMATTPLQTALKVYSGGTESAPGTVVYEADLTGSITSNAFNTHVLATPINITGEDLWLSIEFRLNRSLQTIGCDPGPANTNGDWLYQASDNNWTRFSERTPIDINWNIRGIVEE